MKTKMKNITKFLETYGDAPQVLHDAIENCIGSPEHPIYHPEGTLEKHIDIVVGRCMESDSVELHFTGMLHDIMKPGICEELGWIGNKRKGRVRTIESGKYYQNVNHANHAVKFIELPQVNAWMNAHNVDIEKVKLMVGQHMRMKSYLSGENGRPNGMKKTKRDAMRESLSEVWEELYNFSTYCDNMLI